MCYNYLIIGEIPAVKFFHAGDTSGEMYMDINRIWAVYFSPTGGTKDIAVSVAEQFGKMLHKEILELNYTRPEKRLNRYCFKRDDLVVFGMPVYAGRIPNKILPDIERGFQGENTKLIPVVVYGNRSFGDALSELKTVMQERGFQPLAGAAVVSQHAFTSLLGTDRPDADDRQEIRQFVLRAVDKLKENRYVPELEVMGNNPAGKYYTPLKEDGTPAKFLPAKPVTDIDKCCHCGICAQACPMGSIDQSDYTKVSGVCIKCQACIRKCPAGAKAFADEQFLSHVKMLEKNYVKRADNFFFYSL